MRELLLDFDLPLFSEIMLGNHGGRHHMRSGRTRKQKSPIPKKMFIVVRRLVRKNPQNIKLRIEIVLPREIVYPCFLADP